MVGIIPMMPNHWLGIMKNSTIITAREWLGIMEHFFLFSRFSIFCHFIMSVRQPVMAVRSGKFENMLTFNYVSYVIVED